MYIYIYIYIYAPSSSDPPARRRTASALPDLSIYLSIYLHLSIYLYLSIYLSISIYLSFCLSIYASPARLAGRLAGRLATALDARRRAPPAAVTAAGNHDRLQKPWPASRFPPPVRGNHLSNTTCLTHDFFKRGEEFSKCN